MFKSKLLQGACVAAFLAFSSGVEAARQEGNSSTGPAEAPEFSSTAQSSNIQVPLGPSLSPVTRSQNRRATARSQRSPLLKDVGHISPSVTRKTKEARTSPGENTAKERKIHTLTDEDAGVEYFCRHSRKRLWIQEQGWLVRGVRSCF